MDKHLEIFKAGFEREEEFSTIHRQSISKLFFSKSQILYSIRPDGIAYIEECKDPAKQSTIEVTIETAEDTEILDSHLRAWEFILDNLAILERTSTASLHKIAQENFLEFLADRAKLEEELKNEVDDDGEMEWQEEEGDWNAIKNQEDWNSEECLHKQIDLLGITILSCVHAGVNLVAFDFNVGWDAEHGVSILMHKGEVLASSGIAHFTGRGDQPLRYIDASLVPQELPNSNVLPKIVEESQLTLF
jgi:hypothetical protein